MQFQHEMDFEVSPERPAPSLPATGGGIKWNARVRLSCQQSTQLPLWLILTLAEMRMSRKHSPKCTCSPGCLHEALFPSLEAWLQTWHPASAQSWDPAC